MWFQSNITTIIIIQLRTRKRSYIIDYFFVSLNLLKLAKQSQLCLSVFEKIAKSKLIWAALYI